MLVFWIILWRGSRRRQFKPWSSSAPSVDENCCICWKQNKIFLVGHYYDLSLNTLMILKQALKTNERSYFWQNLRDRVSALEEVCHFSIKKKTNIKDVLSYLSRKCLKFVILFEELIRGTCRISIIMQAYLHKIPSSAVIGQNDVVILPPRCTTTARVTGLFFKSFRRLLMQHDATLRTFSAMRRHLPIIQIKLY